MKYGRDVYGKYVEGEDGERLQVEFYPFWRRYPWRVSAIFWSAYYVVCWHIGRKRQKRAKNKY